MRIHVLVVLCVVALNCKPGPPDRHALEKRCQSLACPKGHHSVLHASNDGTPTSCDCEDDTLGLYVDQNGQIMKVTADVAAHSGWRKAERDDIQRELLNRKLQGK